MKTINYNISKKYLSHWGIEQALREIMQNFMDYGEYDIDILENQHITITSSFVPVDLSFLAIGNSEKKEGARGKYGEGLKMALLIFARENMFIQIETEKHTIIPEFTETELGETFCIKLSENTPNKEGFKITFDIDIDFWLDYYHNKLVHEHDIIFDDNYYGRIVDKPRGNVFCGGIFVAHLKNLSKSYDINVQHLPLTRDRNLPQTWDINWATSKINDKQGIISIQDFTHNDTIFIEKIPEKLKKDIRPMLIGNSIEATYKDKGKDVVIKNDNVKKAMLKDGFFDRTIKRLRNYLLKKIGVYEMLVQFKKKHVHSEEARIEFDTILSRIEQQPIQDGK